MTRRVSRRKLLRYSGLATVALAGCSGGQRSDGTTASAMGTTTQGDMETTETTTSEVAVALDVADAMPDGRTVTIPEVAIDGAGWLVVHPEADGGGPKGTVVLGQRQLSPQTYEDIQLDLDVVHAAPTTVYAMLHYDDPADGEFTFPEHGDPPVTKAGNPVVKPFSVQAGGSITPSLSVTDQESDGSTLTIPSLALDEPGWVVVHPEADGGGPKGTEVLAGRHLEAGRYADLEVSLSEGLSSDQTVYGMLHYADPNDDEFTFPKHGDPPVTKDGSPIVEPFDVTVSGGGMTTTQTVEAVDTAFDPVRLSVAPGTTVEWVNKDSFGHDVTSATFHDVATDWDMSAPLSGSGGTASHTFSDAGVYEYYCTIHGTDTMCGAVLVGDVSLDQDLPCEGDGGGMY